MFYVFSNKYHMRISKDTNPLTLQTFKPHKYWGNEF